MGAAPPTQTIPCCVIAKQSFLPKAAFPVLGKQGANV